MSSLQERQVVALEKIAISIEKIMEGFMPVNPYKRRECPYCGSTGMKTYNNPFSTGTYQGVCWHCLGGSADLSKEKI